MTYVKTLTLRLTQAEVERLTGLSREVLRKWELRYGFPQPLRGTRGYRHYSAEDAKKLTLLALLIKAGGRVGTLIPLVLGDLQSLMDADATRQRALPAPSAASIAQELQGLMTALLPNAQPSAVASFLQDSLARHGLGVFVAYLMPVFNREVGQAWVAGRLNVATEHRFSSSLRDTVVRALPEPNGMATAPRVLLTTPPGELHSLGLLALHAQLRLQGADVVDLGCQTPLADLLQAIDDLKIGVVALSASICMPASVLRRYVSGLVEALPPGCVLWLGGEGWGALKLPAHSAYTLFADTQSAVQVWQTLAVARLSTS
ncbi:MAG: hypothetical protein CO065_14790 [Comamonadaceae bacterium CG_4_9_14_0_8_um_filter_57_21]|nr:MAG: hypothetical protein COY49_06130 [Comamonadaceae bacterium CG_4_10_14_0_8_um_filter_57_29]PJC14242.1 MAG: hypothetical protein CO065_14790 [Comamonadaceae bacterium CG_4_9_14_0_8_um_filter_57_21]